MDPTQQCSRTVSVFDLRSESCDVQGTKGSARVVTWAYGTQGKPLIVCILCLAPRLICFNRILAFD